MKHVLSYEVGVVRLYIGSLNNKDFEAFPVKILIFDDETKTVYEENAVYEKYFY